MAKKNGNGGKKEDEKGYQVLGTSDGATPSDEVTDGKEDSTPEEKAPENPITLKLSGAVKEVTDEIEQCDKKIEKIDKDREEYNEKMDKKKEEFLTKKEELCQQFQEAVSDMQSRFGGFQPAAPETVKSKRGRKPSTDGSTIKDLILGYIQQKGQARTIHIKQFLAAKGRKTNPGVELSRLVKEGVIRNVERGLYAMAK